MQDIKDFDADGHELEFTPGTNAAEREYFLRKYPNVDDVIKEQLHCTSCRAHYGAAPSKQYTIKQHPVMRTTQCIKCYKFYNSGSFDKGTDGSELYCRWCGQGGDVYCCASCPFVFCSTCISANLSSSMITDIENNDNWECFRCEPKPLLDLRARHWALINFMQKRKKQITSSKRNDADEIVRLMNEDPSKCCRGKLGRRSQPVVEQKRKRTVEQSNDEDHTDDEDEHHERKKKKSKTKSAPVKSMLKKTAPAVQPDIVCTPDIMSMILPPEQQNTSTSNPSSQSKSSASTRPAVVLPKPNNSNPPPLARLNQPVVQFTEREVINRQSPIGAPIYHTINGFCIDLNAAAGQNSFKLPNGRTIQVKKQAPRPVSTATATKATSSNTFTGPRQLPVAPAHHSTTASSKATSSNTFTGPRQLPVAPAHHSTTASSTAIRYDTPQHGFPTTPTIIGHNPVNSQPTINAQHMILHNTHLQQQRQLLNSLQVGSSSYRILNEFMNSDVNQRGAPLVTQPRYATSTHVVTQPRYSTSTPVVTQPRHTTSAPVVSQPRPSNPTTVQPIPSVATAAVPQLVKSKFPNTPVGKERSKLEQDIHATHEICQQITSKLTMLMKSNPYKNANSFADVKELRIHLCYLYTYIIGRYQSLQDSCQDDNKRIEALIQKAISAADKRAKYVNDEDDLAIVEPTRMCIDLDSDDENDDRPSATASTNSAVAVASNSAAAATRTTVPAASTNSAVAVASNSAAAATRTTVPAASTKTSKTVAAPIRPDSTASNTAKSLPETVPNVVSPPSAVVRDRCVPLVKKSSKQASRLVDPVYPKVVINRISVERIASLVSAGTSNATSDDTAELRKISDQQVIDLDDSVKSIPDSTTNSDQVVEKDNIQSAVDSSKNDDNLLCGESFPTGPDVIDIDSDGEEAVPAKDHGDTCSEQSPVTIAEPDSEAQKEATSETSISMDSESEETVPVKGTGDTCSEKSSVINEPDSETVKRLSELDSSDQGVIDIDSENEDADLDKGSGEACSKSPATSDETKTITKPDSEAQKEATSETCIYMNENNDLDGSVIDIDSESEEAVPVKGTGDTCSETLSVINEPDSGTVKRLSVDKELDSSDKCVMDMDSENEDADLDKGSGEACTKPDSEAQKEATSETCIYMTVNNDLDGSVIDMDSESEETVPVNGTGDTCSEKSSDSGTVKRLSVDKELDSSDQCVIDIDSENEDADLDKGSNEACGKSPATSDETKTTKPDSEAQKEATSETCIYMTVNNDLDGSVIDIDSESEEAVPVKGTGDTCSEKSSVINEPDSETVKRLSVDKELDSSDKCVMDSENEDADLDKGSGEACSKSPATSDETKTITKPDSEAQKEATSETCIYMNVKCPVIATSNETNEIDANSEAVSATIPVVAGPDDQSVIDIDSDGEDKTDTDKEMIDSSTSGSATATKSDESSMEWVTNGPEAGIDADNTENNKSETECSSTKSIAEHVEKEPTSVEEAMDDEECVAEIIDTDDPMDNVSSNTHDDLKLKIAEKSHKNPVTTETIVLDSETDVETTEESLIFTPAGHTAESTPGPMERGTSPDVVKRVQSDDVDRQSTSTIPETTEESISDDEMEQTENKTSSSPHGTDQASNMNEDDTSGDDNFSDAQESLVDSQQQPTVPSPDDPLPDSPDLENFSTPDAFDDLNSNGIN